MNHPQSVSTLRAREPSRDAKRRVARRWLGWLVTGVVTGCGAPSIDHVDSFAQIDPQAVDDGALVALTGHTLPKANARNSVGRVPDDLFIEQMQLVLRRHPDQETQLAVHMDALHDKSSPQYQKWLTAEQFGAQYGVAGADVQVVSRWLRQHGFHVGAAVPSHMFVNFSGTAGQLRSAFHMELHYLDVKGKRHLANMKDPQFPRELAKVVSGIRGIHDFMPQPLVRNTRAVQRDDATGAWNPVDPDFTVTLSGSKYYALAPGDFATVYNLTPLFSAGITGAGQTIAVLEPTNIKAADWTSFRTAFGLSTYTAGSLTTIHPAGSVACANPGTTGPDAAAEGEAALDAEWASATAPAAAIQLAACLSTSTWFGTDIALQNLVNSASPPSIISYSYGLCESQLSAPSDLAWYSSVYQQAAMEGISVFVSAGDGAAAGCDDPSTATSATGGIAVSGLASTPYNVAVGGTDFMDTYDSLHSGPAVSTYWNTANTTTSPFTSVKSYLPEIPWNDSCASSLIYTSVTGGYTQAYGATGSCNASALASFKDIVGGSGGPSAFVPQPSWQTGVVGLPTKSGGNRYLPDVSLFAGDGVWNHFLVFCMSDVAQGGKACTYPTNVGSLAAGGTSFAAPSLAGIQALINQNMGVKLSNPNYRQGNPNYTYYKLAGAEYGARGSARCSSAGGATSAGRTLPDSSCVFRDVTHGDIDVPCSLSGTSADQNCYGATTTLLGALSPSATTFSPAYPAGTGWDFATGIGTVNAYNLVTAWSQ